MKRWNLNICSELNNIKRPLLLAVAPHMSHSDVVIVPASLPRHLLPVRWLADKKIFTNRVKSIWLKLWGAIPIERTVEGQIQSNDIEWIIDFIQRGACVGVFPECCLVGGMFSTHHKTLVDAVMAENLSVCPVGLRGNVEEKAMKPMKKIKDRPQIIIGDLLSEPQELLDCWSML
ncbi:MAG: 1-acyl-sn-glycerol-3-phosphate acyltransferase [Candidatus Thiodiazotropha sp. (ex Lucinoma borealis)]|nr:1-acyl-sn-glycerol-3-phosphate acyltransferase [Candidatus Thiodiazotropha sp. (ex Lucinoma borealis)]